MDFEKKRERIDEIQSAMPLLQKELAGLLTEIQSKCGHPYIIGWRHASTGFIMTEGEVACPWCGLTGHVTTGESSAKNYRLSPIFEGKPIHWILKEDWIKLFERSTFAERDILLKELDLSHPPR